MNAGSSNPYGALMNQDHSIEPVFTPSLAVPDTPSGIVTSLLAMIAALVGAKILRMGKRALRSQ